LDFLWALSATHENETLSVVNEQNRRPCTCSGRLQPGICAFSFDASTILRAERNMSNGWQALQVSIDGKIGRLLLNRPDVLNALNYTLVLEIEQAVRELENQVRVVLIEGAGENFCAGADLRCVAETQKMREFIEQINRAFFSIEEAPIPVIAAVQGYALAGGFELMQACDIVIVADNAVIGDQHSNFGLIPGGGGSQRLPRLIGRQRALALLLSGARLSGNEAVAWGLAYRSVPLAELREQSMALAQNLAAKSRGGLKAMKYLVNRGAEKPLNEAIDLEVDTFLEWIRSRDAQEGLRAFQDRRSPRFE
jgi:enoyl-CoA hydratase/carnithine racemase